MTQLRTRWRRSSALAAVALAMTMLVAGATPAAAAGPVDQEDSNLIATMLLSGADGLDAQTFTVGRAGRLDQVDVPVQRQRDEVAGDFRVEIRTVSPDGTPSGTVLAAASVPDTQLVVRSEGEEAPPAYVSFPITPIDVTVGQQLAIVLVYPGFFAIGLDFDNTYPGGGHWAFFLGEWSQFGDGALDLGFRTHVSPPLPPPPPPAPDGLLSGVITALTDLLPPLAPLVNPVRSLLRGLGL